MFSGSTPISFILIGPISFISVSLAQSASLVSHWLSPLLYEPSPLHYLEDAVQPPQQHEPAERRAEAERDVDAGGKGEAWQVTW